MDVNRLARSLDVEELQELEDWTISDEAPEDCMDVSMQHGFFAAIVSGPLVLPSEWLPVVYGGESGNFATLKQANRILGLLMRLYNEVADCLNSDPYGFDPLFFENRRVEPPVQIADEWCFGYMRGIDVRRSEWSWLLEDDKHSALFGPLRAMAYFEGDDEAEYNRVHDDPLIFEQTKALIAPNVATIHQLWRQRERSSSGPIHRAAHKVPRNVACPCGSGKKYKNCCGSPLRDVSKG